MYVYIYVYIYIYICYTYRNDRIKGHLGANINDGSGILGPHV